MNKKAQFYFIAAIVFASVFIAIITISNKATSPNPPSFSEEGERIEIEISFLLDYFSRESISDENAKNILVNLSNSYVQKFGEDKEIFFLFGKNNSLITLTGYKGEETELFINTGSGDTIVSETGRFQNNYTLAGKYSSLVLDGSRYNFTFYPGQNVYYLIKSSYNGEIFISNGGTSSSNQ
ncbi:MAG: hypothetical protein Q8Q04_03750 [archaeon]|nr:hypothetical protein [archaeon]